MADFPALPLFTDAYLGDTMHLNLEEHGAYLKLLIIMWRTPDCALEDDDKRLATMLGITGKKWSKLRPVLMNFFSPIDGKKLTQKRLRRERRYVEKKSDQARAAANAKHQKDKETESADAPAEPGAETTDPQVPDGLPEPCETDAPTPTPTESISSLRSDMAAPVDDPSGDVVTFEPPPKSGAPPTETIPPLGTKEHEGWCFAVARQIGAPWVVQKLRAFDVPWREIETIVTDSRNAGAPKDFLLRCFHERQRQYRNGSDSSATDFDDMLERTLGPSGGSA